jgi:hypothetical protein
MIIPGRDIGIQPTMLGNDPTTPGPGAVGRSWGKAAMGTSIAVTGTAGKGAEAG